LMPIEVCDVCGSDNVKEIKCKLICQNCGTILKTCSDLAGAIVRNFALRTNGIADC